jgi:hypothetical protein
MRFESILFPNGSPAEEAREAPSFFPDLNLDRAVADIVAGFDEYELTPFFHAPLGTVDAVLYRQDVMRDLEAPRISQTLRAFSQEMRTVRARLELSRKGYYARERERWLLDAAVGYCDAVRGLTGELQRLDPKSPGLLAFRDYLLEHVETEAFRELSAGAADVTSQLSAIRYFLLIKDGSITVSHYDEQPDYSAEIDARFAKFRRGSPRDYRAKFGEGNSLNHVEAAVLDRIALLFPEALHALAAFAARHPSFMDEAIVRFDREIQFYVAYLQHVEKLRGAGLRFCYPRLSATSKEIDCRGAFDLALADKLAPKKVAVVPNDVSLRGPERILVVTGPNQGGKSTFARMVGQLHYLASLGCLVPGTEARLFLCDRIFTHFEKEEDITNLRGKLQDDIIRVREILDEATPNSVVIMNEIFSSTALKDAVYLSRKIMGALSALDAVTVWVTFLSELAAFDEKTVSMVGTVASDDPTRRTYEVERRPARGLAYSLALAEKHGVTYRRLKERLAS